MQNALRTGCGAILLTLIATACGPPAIDGGFDSPNPAARMYAIENAARTGDVQAARRIVEQLDSDDPAVRLLAIGALQRLTGETHGYCHADPPQRRHVAIERWQQVINGFGPGEFMEAVQRADQTSTGAHLDDG